MLKRGIIILALALLALARPLPALADNVHH